MNFLIVTVEGGGNIPPVLDTIQRLLKNNHNVFVLSEPWMKELVEEQGASFICFTEYFTKQNRTTDITEDWKSKDNAFKNVIFGPADIVARETFRHVKKLNIDIVIADVLTPGALIGAEAAGVKRALLFHLPEYLPGPNRPPGGLGLLPGKNAMGKFRDRILARVFNLIFDRYLKQVNAIRKTFNLPALKHIQDMFHSADLRIIQSSTAFDIPIIPAPKNVRYTGPVLNDPDWVEDWKNPWDKDDKRPLVVVSFSSTFQNQKERIQSSIDALQSLNVRGLVTLGIAMENEQFKIPENVKVIANASHAQIFPHTDVVVTHAGHGTVMRAIANEVPLVCIPMGRDQDDNAAKVQYKGVGIRLSKKASSKSIATAISKILNEPSFKEKAKSIGEQIRSDAHNNQIAEALEELASIKHRHAKITPI